MDSRYGSATSKIGLISPLQTFNNCSLLTVHYYMDIQQGDIWASLNVSKIKYNVNLRHCHGQGPFTFRP